jgi:hypothetical protein
MHIDIQGSWEGAVRLREWVFGRKKHSYKGYIEEGDARLLEKVAVVHANLVLAGQSCQQVLATAAAAVDRQEFEVRILSLMER